MAENDKDGGQSAGGEGNTSPTPSTQKGDSGVQFDAQKLQQAFDSLQNRVNEIDSAYKTFQKGKDRGANEAKKFSEEVEDLRRKVAEIDRIKKLTGIDDDNAAYEEVKFRSDMQTIKEQLAKLNPTPAGNGAVDVAKVIEEVKADPKNPDVVALTSRQWKSADELELALRRHLAGTPQPNGADTSAPPAPPPAKATLTEEGYKKEMRAAPRGPKGDADRAAIQKKYREGGVNIYVDLG